MPQIVEDNGTYHVFPDDATHQEMTAMLKSNSSPSTAQAEAVASAPKSPGESAPVKSPQQQESDERASLPSGQMESDSAQQALKIAQDYPNGTPGQAVEDAPRNIVPPMPSAWELANTTPDALKIPDPSNATADKLSNLDVTGISGILRASLTPEHYASVQGSVLSGATHLVNSLLTPLGVASAGASAAFKGISKPLAIAFGLYQFHKNPEQLKAIGESANFDERAHRIADLLVGDTAAAFGLAHGASIIPDLLKGGETPHATQEISQPESVRQEPQDGTQSGQAQGPSPGDQLLSPAQGQRKVTTVTTTGEPETPEQEARRMLANIGPREERPIIGKATQPLTMRLGGGESGALNLDVLKDATEEYLKGWASRVGRFSKYVQSVQRARTASEQRDAIPALWDAAENHAGYAANQARSSVELQTPSKVADQAATFVQQANGDKTGMIAKLNGIRGKEYDPVIDYAEKHWDDLQAAADKAKEATDAAHQAAVASGIDLSYREGYVKGAYDEYDPHNRQVVFDAQKGGAGTPSGFAKPKTFNDYTEAIAAGYKPNTLQLSKLTQSAVLNVMRKVNRREWVSALGTMKMPDGLAVITNPERIVKPTMTPKGVVPMDHGMKAPDGYRLLNLQGSGMVAVHEDAYPLVKKLTDDSHFSLIVSEIAGGIKHNILAFDMYHGSRFGQMQMAMMRQKTPSYKAGLSIMQYADPDLAAAVKKGEITPEQAAYAKANRPIVEGGIRAGANIGRIGDALWKDVAPLFPYAKVTSKFIFDKLSRGIIAESYVYAFKRNQGLHPQMSEPQLHRFTSKEINTYYRNLGSQGILKSKTAQDTARFLMLAPQWFEGRLRSEGRGIGQLVKAPFTGKVGNVGAAMGTGLVAYFALGQIVNMLTRGQPTWQNPEPGHKLDAWIPDPGGSNGQFISPLSVFAETTHDVQKLHERGTPAMNIPESIGMAQVGPVPTTIMDVAAGYNFFAGSLHGMDRFTQAAKDLAPIPLVMKGQSSAGSTERQVMSFAGLKSVGAGTASNNAYKLADAGAAITYTPLRQALEVGDMKRARTELRELRKTVDPDLIDKHFSSLDNVRFTGRKSTEEDFKASLKPKELRLYDKAITERERVMERYDRIK